MPAETAVRPLEAAVAAIDERAHEVREEVERAWRLDRLVAESDALLAALEGCNLRERKYLPVRLIAKMNGFIGRVLFELPETVAITCVAKEEVTTTS